MSDLQAGIEAVLAAGSSSPTVARDPVNQPMIHHWVDAVGDKNPIYVDAEAARAAGHPGIVAPPAMIQVWTMMGLGRSRSDDDPLARAMKLFDDAGYVGVVATNCDQTYHRYLQPGEQVAMSAEIVGIVGPKQTALGEGYFINQKISWHTAGAGAEELVAEMDWRIMKFLPAANAAKTETAAIPEDLDPDKLMRPSSSRDTKFFWDGVNAHELRIQRRPDGTLQHPPVPAMWADKDAPADYVVSSGKGAVFSYVVHHAPKVPGRTLPFVIALVELEEGVRMLGELRGVDSEQVKIGMPVTATYIDFPDSEVSPAWTLYAWEPQA
ncbi:bifunctional MaoC family dehydratase N-terminal/OB-fold nucleic acid binding domain-containing protein [Mycolicibacterium neoaurum]|uniref:bifunctional MaoC family dehydratase N-terminal/OB-fold nucleic acid binding domain-containing protein n=1 Tax=Mycolicibacterium neoaurum TaxID=1795 RepID=UPI00248B32D2|nr:bifunctional MaoC family dehydratase N-terminal/OB-fold nucleic acid binding domain-containing protein [Mycolicibacterium neoaurum]WBP93878.1 bifunctional MaoC family dehydratase N-terminal/OB-fold nucleic acid binding domain-containing protein [Mycolicibacterium neoaurum]WBS07767.1 bifunctional MaoC family dehydratase N-terminal/OB-fold nucleic acid binding domain-containing protein [Mycolicibacterium neoaurum]